MPNPRASLPVYVCSCIVCTCSLGVMRIRQTCTLTNTTQFWPPSADVPPLQFEASGFLYKQVRHMVGAMLTVGWGRLSLEDISTALELGNARPPGVHVHCGCCVQCHFNPPVVYLSMPAAAIANYRRLVHHISWELTILPSCRQCLPRLEHRRGQGVVPLTRGLS